MKGLKRLFFFSIMLLASHALSSPNKASTNSKQLSQPRYSYKDAVRESIFVMLPPSNIPIAVDIIRPRETEHGLKVPVILNASPYYEKSGRGSNFEIKKYDAQGIITQFPLFYDNYFVPRGYAVVLVDAIGTNRSHGCPSIGGKQDIDAVKIVIDWLNGRARAVDRNGAEKKALWATGKVGMIGKSYDGTIANGVAATGVDGLSTVVSVASVQNWYDWVFPNAHPDMKSMPWMFDYVINDRNMASCLNDRERIVLGEDRTTLNYNLFWDERNYLKDSKKIKASFFVVSGLNDFNVRMNQAEKLWQALSENNIPRKLWLSQSGHVDPFDYRREAWVSSLHRWFDYWLLGIDSGIMMEHAVSIERGENNWEEQASWPNKNAQKLELFLTPSTDSNKGTVTSVPPPAGSFQSYVSDGQRTPVLEFFSPPLTRNVRLNGNARITLMIKTNVNYANIGVILSEAGKTKKLDQQDKLNEKNCWGESSDADSACYAKYQNLWKESVFEQVTFAFVNARHWRSRLEDESLVPEKWYSVTVDAFADDHEFKAGNQLGITIIRSDNSSKPATVTIDLSKSKIILPVDK